MKIIGRILKVAYKELCVSVFFIYCYWYRRFKCWSDVSSRKATHRSRVKRLIIFFQQDVLSLLSVNNSQVVPLKRKIVLSCWLYGGCSVRYALWWRFVFQNRKQVRVLNLHSGLSSIVNSVCGLCAFVNYNIRLRDSHHYSKVLTCKSFTRTTLCIASWHLFSVVCQNKNSRIEKSTVLA